MAERIVPATAALAERERKAIEDMKALFPDGNVSGLDYVDKALGKRLSKLYRVLGYETRGEMIEAFGFRQEGGKGGRPTELDPEAIFAELQDRYDGMPKPKAYGLLVNENPDLKGKLKTLSNKSNELFGRSLTKELIARGLLDRAPVEEKPEMSDDEILEGLKRLEEKYADSTDRVKTLTALKSKDPDAKPIIEALDSKRSRELLGTTAADYFKSHGILEGGARFTDASDIEEAINALAELSKDIPDDDKPKTIADVCARYPDYSALIKAGQQKKVLTKNTLMERGIIGLTQAAKKAKEKLARERCVRNAEVPDLLRMYCGSGGDALVLPDGRHDFLRPGVIGLDARSGYELRESTLMATDVSGVELGDKLDVSYVATNDYSSPCAIVLTKDGSRIAEVPRPESGAFVARQPFEVDTDLNDYIECTVKGIDQAGNRNIVRIRHRFLHPIAAETMVYALRGIDAISDEELLGGDSWRDRLDTMPESVDFTDAGKRIAESANAGPMLDDNHGSAKNLSTGNETSKQDGQVEHVPYVLSEKTPPTIKIVDDALEGVSAPESIEGKMTENGAPFIAFGINAKENGSSTNADDEGSASTGFSFGISRKSEPTESSNGAQAEYEAEERARQEAEEKARREAEEAARLAEEQARREAAERAEREKREAEERAERERQEAEEKARREAEEAARLAEEQARKEAAEKAEREKRAVEAKRSSLQADIDKLNASLAEMRRERDVYAARKKEIERLEATVKVLNAEIAKLGLFKNKEKKAKREELAQAMAEIASLKERNVGASSKDHEIAAAEKRLSEISEELKTLPEL